MIFIDTWVWLEFLGKAEKSEACEEIILRRGEKCISTAGLLEIGYHAMRMFGPERAAAIVYYLESQKGLNILPVTVKVARFAAELRFKYYRPERRLSFVDSVNLATAILTECTALYTGDSDFQGIEEIRTVIV